MPVFLKEEKSCLFLHIPKSGGTSFGSIANSYGWKEYFSIRGVSAKNLKFLKVSPQHFHAELFKDILVSSEIDKIILIHRNPYTRLKSEYYWQVKSKITKEVPNKWIDRVLREARNDAYVYDNHLRSQTDFLIDDERLKCFRLEDNGVENAISYLNDGNSEAESIKLVKNGKQIVKNKVVEKQSDYIKDVEKVFRDNYLKICDFYKNDFEKFEYKIDEQGFSAQ